MQKSLKAFTSSFYMWKGEMLPEKHTRTNRTYLKNDQNQEMGPASGTQVSAELVSFPVFQAYCLSRNNTPTVQNRHYHMTLNSDLFC